MKKVLRVPRAEARGSICGSLIDNFSRVRNVLHGGSIVEAFAEAQMINFSRVRDVLHRGSVAEAFAEEVLTSNQIRRNKNHSSPVRWGEHSWATERQQRKVIEARRALYGGDRTPKYAKILADVRATNALTTQWLGGHAAVNLSTFGGRHNLLQVLWSHRIWWSVDPRPPRNRSPMILHSFTR